MSSTPLRVTAEQIAAAQLRIVLDEKLHRHTPDVVRRIAAMTSADSAEDSLTSTTPSSIKTIIPAPDPTPAPASGVADYKERISADHTATEPLDVSIPSAPTVSIQTLGMFRVLRDGFQIPTSEWQSKKSRTLLKILVARRRPTSRDELMELLWPDTDRSVASNRLAVLLSTVRDVLQSQPEGENPLIDTNGATVLNLSRVHVDLENFLTQATAALAAHRANAPDANAQIEAALAAHTGDFLEAEPYYDWAAATAEQVRAVHIALLQAITARVREAGDTDAAVQYTLRLLEQDRYDERAYLSLVTVLLNAGRLGEARRYYQTYIRRMKEIDVQPSPLLDIPSREVDAG